MTTLCDRNNNETMPVNLQDDMIPRVDNSGMQVFYKKT